LAVVEFKRGLEGHQGGPHAGELGLHNQATQVKFNKAARALNKADLTLLASVDQAWASLLKHWEMEVRIANNNLANLEDLFESAQCQLWAIGISYHQTCKTGTAGEFFGGGAGVLSLCPMCRQAVLWIGLCCVPCADKLACAD
jgi:hypothetical protein